MTSCARWELFLHRFLPTNSAQTMYNVNELLVNFGMMQGVHKFLGFFNISEKNRHYVRINKYLIVNLVFFPSRFLEWESFSDCAFS